MTAPDLDFAERLQSFGSSVYKSLRQPQARALAGYAKRIEEPDLAIELPTGYGKTLVALLIADLALDQGQRVAYLTGNNQLTDQVLAHAGALPGLDAVRFSGKNYPPASLARYNGAQALGVMNYWVYFNSRPVVEHADLLIFDDAHLAEQPISGLFGVRVGKREHPDAYSAICEVVTAHTDLYPSVDLMRAGLAGPGTPPELIAFSHWTSVQPTVSKIITGALDDTFTWPLVQGHLDACGLLIGPSAIEVRPYNPPTQTFDGYRRSRQRVYLSATLGTMDDLQRRLGVLPIANSLDERVAAGEVGERLFLLNPNAKSTLNDSIHQFALGQSRRTGRTAWLCSSHAEADQVELVLGAAGATTFRLRSGSADAMERWLDSAHGHLVTAGRYDGFDFAGDKCRLVVLPSVPAASTEFERFVMAYLGDATFMRHRVGQRVTQALGRANRESEDWAMYVGLSPDFGTLLAQSAVQAAIPPDVRPVVDDALTRLEGGVHGAARSADAFWSRSAQPQVSARSTDGTRRRPGRGQPSSTSGSASHEVAAATRLWLGDGENAAREAKAAAAVLRDAGEQEHAAFWGYVAAQALQADGQPRRAIEALEAVTTDSPATGWFVRLSKVLGDLRGESVGPLAEEPFRTWDDWMRESGRTRVQRAVSQAITNIGGTHDQQAEALETLGRMLGLDSMRPRGQAVTDATWSWSSRRRVERRLWEVKTGLADAIPRDWVDQVLGQVVSEGGSSVNVTGCVVTSLEVVSTEARDAARDHVRFVHVDATHAIAVAVGDRLNRYASLWGDGSAQERGAARAAVEGLLPHTGWLERLLRPSSEILRATEVRAEFS